MFVVMALVTTVATTPITKALYPPWYQKKVERWRRGEIDWDGNALDPSEPDHGTSSVATPAGSQIRRLMVHLRLDSLPSLFTFITLLSAEGTAKTVKHETPEGESQDTEIQIKKRPLEVHGLRVLELTDRTSSVMHLTEGEDFYSLRDPVVNAFRTFSQLHDVAVSGRVSVVPADAYAETLMGQASDVSSDFALIPWGECGSMTEDQSFPVSVNTSERFKSVTHLDFINQTFEKAVSTCNTGIFIDNGFGGITKPVDRPNLTRTRSAISLRSHRDMAVLPVANKSHHIFFPFFGGIDDRVALRIVLQLAKNPHVTATVVRLNWLEGGEKVEASKSTTTPSVSSETKTVVESQEGGTVTPPTEVLKKASGEQDTALFSSIRKSLPEELADRVKFTESNISPKSALTEVLLLAQQAVGLDPKNAGDVVVLGRRHAVLDENIGTVASGSTMTPDMKRTVGAVADQMVTTGIKASVLVVQAGGRGLET